MHLVGFIIRIYHSARSPERQIQKGSVISFENCRKYNPSTACSWTLKENLKKINFMAVSNGGMQWRSWLRHRATSQKVAGSIADGVIGIFHFYNPSSFTMALGLT